MKKIICVLLCVLSLLSLFSCTTEEQYTNKYFETKDDFSNASIGVLTGSAFDKIIKSIYPNANIVLMDDESTRIAALQKGTIDAVCGESALTYAYAGTGIEIFPEEIAADYFGFGFVKGSKYTDEFSKVIKKFKEDGTIKELEGKWISYDRDSATIDWDSYKVESSEELVIYTEYTLEPFTYIGNNGQLAGFDIELLLKICKELGYNAKFETIKFAGLLNSLVTGKADVIAGSISITEERKESIDFCEAYYDAGLYFFVDKNRLVPKDFEINDKNVTIAVMSDYVSQAEKIYPNATFKYVLTNDDLILYLTSGQADVIIEKKTFYDTMVRNGITNVKIHSDGAIGDKGYVVAGVGEKTAIPNALNLLNSFIEEIKSNGILDEISYYWEVECKGVMPEIEMPENPKYTIRVGTSGLVEPYTYYGENNELIGKDIEIAKRFAVWLGADIEFYTYGWEGLAPALATNKVDFVFSNWYYTDERQEAVLLSEPYNEFYDTPIIIDKDAKKTESTFFDDLKNSFNKTFIRESRWKLVVKGLLITILITLTSAIIGTVLGFLFYLAKALNKKWLNVLLKIYAKVFSGIPSLVILMIVYFVIFAQLTISPEFASIIAFSLIFTNQCYSLFTASIENIDKGQVEAATALGFSKTKIYTKVILPQATVFALPLYKGEIVGLLKLTSIAGYIATMDLTKAGDIIRSRTYEAFFPLIAIALIYFGLAELVILLLSRVELTIKPQKNKLPKGVNPNVHTTKEEIQKITEKKEVIKLSHIKKAYEKVTPLKDINASIYTGDVVTIIGPSGTGKSTLLRMMNCLEKPTSGSVIAFGWDLNDKRTNLPIIRAKMGMVFQNFNLFSNMNIVENVMSGPVFVKKMSRQQAYEKAMMLLKEVGLGERALDMPELLSGGQKQRVAIARALAMEPRVILFDEPTSALDPGMVGEVLTVMKNLASTGMTMVIVTHEMAFARNVSTRIFYLDDGTVYEEGSPDKIFGNPERNRTRVFINKIKTMSFEAATKDYDFISLVNNCSEFATRYRFTEKRTENLMRIAEEAMSLLPFDENNTENKHLFAEFDDLNDALSVHITWKGEEFDIMSNGDEIALSLIKSSCKEYEKTYENGRNTIIFKGL